MPTSIEHKLEAVRIQNERATRILQIADDRIFYHQLKDQESWPGFEPLLDRSLDIVDLYTTVFRPARLKMAFLHDVDIVKIPLAGQAIELDEYFKLVRELPQEPFGLIQGYATGYVTVSPHDGEPLQFSLQLLPTPPDAQECVFRIDWHKRCGKVDFSDRNTIRNGLIASHNFVIECFRASFEVTALAMFDPEKEQMPFFIADNPNATVQAVEMRYDRDDSFRSMGSIVDVQPMQISKISVGNTTYPLRQQLIGSYVRALETLTVKGISPLITGEGQSSDSALEDFNLKVHAAMQDLLVKRPFEMSIRERLVWDVLNEYIDTTVYRNTTPVSVRQFGVINRARPYPEELLWESGTTERISLRQVASHDFINYKPGQPFEAVVLRNPITFELIQIMHIDRRRAARRRAARRRAARRRAARRLAKSEESNLLEDVGSTSVLQMDTNWKP